MTETDKRKLKESKESHDLLISADNQEQEELTPTNIEADIEPDEAFKTQHSDGHTHNPYHAVDQGLTYTPPSDPPVKPGDDPQGAEVAAGFAPSMEESSPTQRQTPARLKDSNLHLRDTIYRALQTNSETAHLTNVKVQVEDGAARLLGTVESQDDIKRVNSIVNDLDGIAEVQNNLQVSR